jgi:hypothetical protein
MSIDANIERMSLMLPGSSWSTDAGSAAQVKKYEQDLESFYKRLSAFIRNHVVACTTLETEQYTFSWCNQEAERTGLVDWSPEFYLLIDWSAPYLSCQGQITPQDYQDDLHMTINDALHDEGFIDLDKDFDSVARVKSVVHWLEGRESGMYRQRAFVELFWEEED